MKTMLARALLVVSLTACMTAGRACSEEPKGDGEFRDAMAKFYGAWLGKNIFSAAYDIHQKITVGETVTEEDSEVRVTFDPTTQHFICEKHAWTMPPRGRGRPYRYWFYRWDGKVIARGGSAEPRMAMANGHWVQKLADVPVGTPLCSSVTLTSNSTSPAAICPPLEPLTQAMGLTFDGKGAGSQLVDIWKNPEARWEQSKDQTQLILGPKRYTFDMKLGLMTAHQDDSVPKLSWQITHFVDRVPAEMTFTRVATGVFPGLELHCRALPDQCGLMSRDQFETVLHQAFPPDVGVVDLSSGATLNGIRVLTIPAGALDLKR